MGIGQTREKFLFIQYQDLSGQIGLRINCWLQKGDRKMNRSSVERKTIIAFTVGLAGVLLASGCGTPKAKREYQPLTREMNQDAAKAQQERDLAAYADMRFAGVCMEPKVMLSPRAKALKLSFAFAGKDLQTFKKYFAERNWLGVMKLLDPYQKDEFDNKDSIDSAVRKLKTKRFQLLVKAKPASVPRDKFCYLAIPGIDDPDAALNFAWLVVTGGTDWEACPDGSGVMHTWAPADREILLLVSEYPDGGDKGDAITAREAIDEQFRNLGEELARKTEREELDQATAKAQLRTLKSQKRDSYLALLNQF